MNTKAQPPDPDGDDIASLIRLSGMRTDAPPEVAARARDTVRAAWQDTVRGRARRRRLWAGAGMAAAASLILAVVPLLRSGDASTPAPLLSPVQVGTLVGQAWVQPINEPAAAVLLGAGDTIPFDSEVVTGADGRVGLKSADGYSIRIDTQSRAGVVSERRFDLFAGAIYLDSGSESDRESQVEVRTLYGTARPVGTQFEVRLADSSVLVRVRRGTVELTGSHGPHDVPAGDEVRLDSQGRASRRAIDTVGSDWAWVQQVMPGFDIDGQHLRGLLDWASREGGFRLAFADDETERLASLIVLTGRVDGLSVEEALGAVLPTCNMGYRVDQGELTVFQATEGQDGRPALFPKRE